MNANIIQQPSQPNICSSIGHGTIFNFGSGSVNNYCFLLFQEMRDSPRKIQNPEVDLLSDISQLCCLESTRTNTKTAWLASSSSDQFVQIQRKNGRWILQVCSSKEHRSGPPVPPISLAFTCLLYQNHSSCPSSSSTVLCHHFHLYWTCSLVVEIHFGGWDRVGSCPDVLSVLMEPHSEQHLLPIS